MRYSINSVLLPIFFLGLFLCSENLSANKTVVQVESFANNVNDSLLDNSQFEQLFQCNKTFKYKIYLGEINAGNLERTIVWHKNKAIITSAGKARVLGLGSTYQQVSYLHWSTKYSRFYTDSFSQTIKGLDAREMVANITNNGTNSDVILDNEKSHYQSESSPLYDLDTLGEQLRLELIKGTASIELDRQASDKIKHYHFSVVGKETIIIEPWGQVETIRINEIGDYDGTILWFSPEHDFQLLKAKIDAFISPTVVLNEFKKDCT